MSVESILLVIISITILSISVWVAAKDLSDSKKAKTGTGTLSRIDLGQSGGSKLGYPIEYSVRQVAGVWSDLRRSENGRVLRALRHDATVAGQPQPDEPQEVVMTCSAGNITFIQPDSPEIPAEDAVWIKPIVAHQPALVRPDLFLPVPCRAVAEGGGWSCTGPDSNGGLVYTDAAGLSYWFMDTGGQRAAFGVSMESCAAVLTESQQLWITDYRPQIGPFA